LEEWLSGVTKLSSGAVIGEGDHSVPAYIQALLEQTAESLDQLQRVVSRGEDERGAIGQGLAALTDRLTTLSDNLRAEQSVMMSLAESQTAMKGLLTKLTDQGQGRGDGLLDENTRGHIRNLDVRLERMSADVSSGRDKAVEELRGEIRLLTRTIAALSEEQR
jgi:polyhydroxyalkanoate synthesis regulator phasin